MFLTKYTNQFKDWFYKNSESKSVKSTLAVITFLESSIFPIPPDPFLMAVLMVKRKNWFYYSLFVTFFSVLGAILGYVLGYLFFDLIGSYIVRLYSLEAQLLSVQILFKENLFMTMFTAAFTPIPFKIFTISAGLLKVNFWVFIFASVIGRFLRFFAVALIMRIFGKKIGEVVFRYFNLATLIVAILFVIYILIKFLM